MGAGKRSPWLSFRGGRQPRRGGAGGRERGHRWGLVCMVMASWRLAWPQGWGDLTCRLLSLRAGAPGVHQGRSRALLRDLDPPQQKRCRLHVLGTDKGLNRAFPRVVPRNPVGSRSGAGAARPSLTESGSAVPSAPGLCRRHPSPLSGFRLESSKMQKMQWESRLA